MADRSAHRPHAVIFDCDDTLIATTRALWSAVTSGIRDLVRQDIATLGLADAFDYVCGQEELDWHKPDPRRGPRSAQPPVRLRNGRLVCVPSNGLVPC